MAVANTNNSVAYNGDGVTTAFPTTFKFLANTDLIVRQTIAGLTYPPMALGVAYTVAGAGNDEPGGTVNMVTAPAIGTVITISRATALIQPVTLPQSGALPVKSVNGEFDRLTLGLQDARADITALQAGLVPVALAAAMVQDTFTPLDPVETSFPRNVACVGTPKEVIVAKVEDLTNGSTIHYGLGFADVGSFIANQFTVNFIPGLVPGDSTRITYMVLT